MKLHHRNICAEDLGQTHVDPQLVLQALGALLIYFQFPFGAHKKPKASPHTLDKALYL